ncbi:type IV pilus modification protein PilV [Endozoicomonas atrinae]|uniref:type IV pilus modification protein PilV n=1 Tax=Endozoicomonas atrinae TaxID=1333660 RepID=UPI000825AA7F|nr:type IV pilus modification protein PilV [Endozoicomonas atrinae]
MQLSDYFFVPALSLAIDRNRTNTFTTKAQRNRARAEKTPEKKNRGVGLVEVLISLLVITIGILGMAGVHSSSLQYNQSSYVQSQATFLATDMLDRIQANNSLARSGTNYQVGLNDLEYSQCIESGYPNNCETGSCSPQEMAAYDILQWKFQLTCQLPGSKGSITYLDSNGVRTYIIRLSFPDMGNRVPLSDVVLRGIL